MAHLLQAHMFDFDPLKLERLSWHRSTGVVSTSLSIYLHIDPQQIIHDTAKVRQPDESTGSNQCCSLSSLYATRYPQNAVRCGDQATVVRISRSEAAAAPARSALTCVGQAFAEVVIKAITAGAVNYWGLAAMGRCRIASRSAPHTRRPCGSSVQTTEGCEFY